MFYNLFQIVKKGKRKGFRTTPVIRGGAKPFLVVNIEVPCKENFGVGM